MQVTIRLFAGLRERAGTGSLTVTLPDVTLLDDSTEPGGATVQDAIDAASSQVDGVLNH